MEFYKNTSFIIFSLLLVLLLANTVHSRKDPGEYWVEIMKGEAMPQAIIGIVEQGPLGYEENNKAHNHEPVIGRNPYIKDFDPRPNVSIYHDDVNPNQVKGSATDCETNHDGSMSKKSFTDDFEPRPNVTTYND